MTPPPSKQITTPENLTAIKKLVASRYKDPYGNPFQLTDGQAGIFWIIATKAFPRIHCMCYTQYGKSDTVSMAVLTRVTTYPEKVAIVAPSNKKAKIIMGDLIEHTFDNQFTLSMFEPEKGENLDRVRRERSKEHMTFKHPDGRLGEVFTLSSEGKRTTDLLDALLGFGAQNVIIDESSLIDDVPYVGILRMLGGFKDTLLFEIGNPMRRNHFMRASRDPTFEKINIDVEQGVAEGRIERSFVEMMRSKPMFKQLYLNQFPDEDSQDTGGYSALFTEDFIKASLREEDLPLVGNLVLGCDVAGEGANYSVITLRSKNAAKVLYRQHNGDTMNFAGIIAKTAEEYGITQENIFVDAVGIGKGVVDRLREIGLDVVPVLAGEPSSEPDFFNKRAQMYWRLKEWMGGGELVGKENWYELLNIRYKVQSDKKIQMKSKPDMLRDGIISPDVADSLALTFYSDIADNNVYERQRNRMENKRHKISTVSSK